MFSKLNPEPVLRFDSDGNIQEANPAAHEAFSKGKLRGHNIKQLLQIGHLDLTELIENSKIKIVDTKLNNEVFRFIIRGVKDLEVCQCYGSNVTEKVEILKIQEKRIHDSLESAKKIQQAAIPSDELIQRLLPGSFVFFQPRDVVSGDFYWITKKDHKVCFATVDCTGHGVPGGFMSMLGISLLNEIARSDIYQEASEILNEMRNRVKNTLFQSEESLIKDGMDMALCIYDTKTNELQYSGAYNPLVICGQDAQPYSITGDRMPVGMHYKEKPSFTNHSLIVNPYDVIYIFSDGFADQFGGENNQKYMRKRLYKFFSRISKRSSQEQKEALGVEFEKWKGSNEQIDDVLVSGVRFRELLKAV